jgi:hypothetical protein
MGSAEHRLADPVSQNAHRGFGERLGGVRDAALPFDEPDPRCRFTEPLRPADPESDE